MGKTYLNTMIILLCLLFVGSACTFNQATMDGTTLPGNGIDNASHPTSTISIGNPKLHVNLSSTVYLSMQQQSDNLKQIQDISLASVLSYVDDTGAVMTSATSSVPTVKQFVLGPNGEMVIEFEEATAWDNQNCLLVYSNGIEEICIQDASVNIQGDVQFDAAGSVFYAAQTTGQDFVSLIRWSPDVLERESLINQNIVLGQWRVHANGLVYLTGSEDSVSFFRTIDPTNDVATNLVADASEVTSFNLIDSELLILQGQNIDYNNTYQAGNFIFDTATNTITEKLDMAGGDLDDLQIDSHNRVYMIVDNTLYKIYPGVSYEVATELDEVDLFKIFDDVIYASGQKDRSNQFVALDLDENAATAHVIENNIKVCHLEHDGDALYFSALDFLAGVWVIQKYDLIDEKIATIQTSNSDLVQLKSVTTPQNYSFAAREFKAVQPDAIEISQEHLGTYPASGMMHAGAGSIPRDLR